MIAATLEAIATAVEAQTALLESVVANLRELGERDIELADNIIDLERRLGYITRRSRVVLNMKACDATTDCLRCGATFAAESGPELCGPCWTELGRPERYLAPVPPIGA